MKFLVGGYGFSCYGLTMKKLLVALLFLAATATSTLGQVRSASAIIGGERTQTYSWLVAFVEVDDGENLPPEERVICSGVLVASRWVMTAAHCQLPRDTTQVVIGRDDLRQGDGEKRWIQQTGEAHIRYPAWIPNRDTNDGDVMLVKLDQASSQTPLRIAGQADTSSWNVGSSVRAYGYGLTSNTNPESYSRYSKFTINAFEADHYVVSASWTGRSACHGDSGGPVITSTPDGPAIIGVNGQVLGDPCINPGGVSEQSITKVGFRSSLQNSPLWFWTDCILDGHSSAACADAFGN
jgi:secreted trypsin-like serine protease